MSKKNNNGSDGVNGANHDAIHTVPLEGLYKDWFLDYASYVILERAVPRIEDGFKPVQRRIMHALKEMDDGRFNKVANVIGSAMQYHPHGDAAIGEAIVNMGQKGLLFDTQGNWGDVVTGDGAAAPRYIEARLSKFALDVVYNPDTTDWQLSYDGRKKEPVTLPVKFPLLLAQGVEGIAVGLSTKILPHNFIELIKASIDVLKGKNPKLYPDFPTGGIADFSEYDQGYRGGKIKVRAKIEILDKKTLVIKEIPFSTTTTSLIESIVKASEKGKIKVKQVVDNTAQNVEIQLHLQPGQAPEIAIDALYAFTDCEISISPNACVIVDDKPQFMKVGEILKINTEQTVALLKRELEIKKAELMEKILFSSLEKIFIEKRIYRSIEEVTTFEGVVDTIDKGLKPYKKQFYREITRDDILRLMEIRIKRISKYDSFKADEMLRDLEQELKDTIHHLKHLTEFAISYFQNLLDKYGKGRERRTEIKSFQSVTAAEVIANNAKLYVNKADGFIGWSNKQGFEFVQDCSELDDIIAIRKDGKAVVKKIGERVFMGKDILYAGVFKKGDERMVYNMIYTDGKTGKSFAKRFTIPGVTREKEYPLAQDNPNSKVHYLTANPNGEAQLVEVKLTPSSTARKKVFEYDFSELEIKGRGARGNTITKYPVRSVVKLEDLGSTLSGVELWFDSASGRLNKDKRGKHLGKFDGNDRILSMTTSGNYKITGFDLTTRFEPDDKVILIEKFSPKKVISAVYWDGGSKQYFVKRFVIETTTPDKEFNFISESIGSKLVVVTTSAEPEVELEVVKGKEKVKETVNLEDIIDVKGWKAMGNRLSQNKVTKVALAEDPEDSGLEEGDDDNELVDAKTTETSKGSPSSKKKSYEAPANKWEPDPEPAPAAGQASLFGEPKKERPKKVQPKQADLFQKEEVRSDKAFKPGETIEFDL